MYMSVIELQALIVGMLALGYFCELLHHVAMHWKTPVVNSWSEFFELLMTIDFLSLLAAVGFAAITSGYVLMCLDKSGFFQ